MSDPSTYNVEIAIRAAMLAKSALALVGAPPDLARRMIEETVMQATETRKWLRGQ